MLYRSWRQSQNFPPYKAGYTNFPALKANTNDRRRFFACSHYNIIGNIAQILPNILKSSRNLPIFFARVYHVTIFVLLHMVMKDLLVSIQIKDKSNKTERARGRKTFWQKYSWRRISNKSKLKNFFDLNSQFGFFVQIQDTSLEVVYLCEYQGVVNVVTSL